MAEGDLLKLIKRAERYIGKDTEWYRAFLDLHVHQFTMTLPSVTNAIKAEIGDELFNKHQVAIIAASKDYIAEVYKNIKVKRALILNWNGDETGFTVTMKAKDPGSIGGKAFKPTKNGPQMYYETKGTSVFRHINDAKRLPQQKLVNTLNAVLRTPKPLDSTNFIDTGHDLGVAEKMTKIGLGDLNAAIKAAPAVAAVAAGQARLDILSKFERGSKKFVVSVTEESAKANRSKATQEKEFKAQTLTLLRQFIEDNKDWARQGGSDSKVQEVRKTIINAAIKGGGKGKKQKIDTKSSKVSKVIKGRTTTSKISNQESMEVNTPKEVVSPPSYVSLISLLNTRLPPAVRSNMIKPALVNRSGVFSESVKVVNITKSPQGFLVIDYNYNREPYDVFDPVLGTAPWATPSRDPKKLIDRSVRSAARGIITERFYTRRAR